MYYATGNPWEGFDAQKNFENKPSITNILDVSGFLRSAVNIGELHSMVDSFFDRFFFFLFLILLPAIWRLNKAYFFYALASGLVPAMSNYFFSYSRFFILCFPLFIVLAEKLRPHDVLFWYSVGIVGAIQIVFLIRHLNFYWAG